MKRYRLGRLFLLLLLGFFISTVLGLYGVPHLIRLLVCAFVGLGIAVFFPDWTRRSQR